MMFLLRWSGQIPPQLKSTSDSLAGAKASNKRRMIVRRVDRKLNSMSCRKSWIRSMVAILRNQSQTSISLMRGWDVLRRIENFFVHLLCRILRRF